MRTSDVITGTRLARRCRRPLAGRSASTARARLKGHGAAARTTVPSSGGGQPRHRQCNAAAQLCQVAPVACRLSRCRRARPCRRPRSEALRSGTQALRQGKTEQALMELEYAAEQGVPGAHLEARAHVRRRRRRRPEHRRAPTTISAACTAMHGDRSAPARQTLASWPTPSVTLGTLPSRGIPGTLKADPNVAREMFRYAASTFRRSGGPISARTAVPARQRCIQGRGSSARAGCALSANKGDHRAQALLGGMLFKGEAELSRQAALGLFWLHRRQGCAGTGRAWITDMYTQPRSRRPDDSRARTWPQVSGKIG